MALVVDSHAHVFPEKISRWIPERVRKSARDWYRPFTHSLHKVQTLFRYLPNPARKRLDQVSGVAPLPGLLLESTYKDLKLAMGDAGIDLSIVIAHPKLIPNEYVLELCSQDRSLVPVVNIPSGTSRPGQVLKKLWQKGARILKLHPASDGEGVDSPRYKALLKVASEIGMPVIVHTGCMHSHLLYKDPEQGQAQRFSPWFETYRNIPFVLAHMNLHEPHVALDLAEEHPNVYVETSWQPMEIIGEAARRIGAERILFGSDWPFVGNNLSVGVKRVRDCVEIGMLNENQAALILGENAVKLLGLKPDATA